MCTRWARKKRNEESKERELSFTQVDISHLICLTIIESNVMSVVNIDIANNEVVATVAVAVVD